MPPKTPPINPISGLNLDNTPMFDKPTYLIKAGTRSSDVSSATSHPPPTCGRDSNVFLRFQCDIFTGYLTTFDMSVFLSGFDRHVSFGIKHFQSIFHLLLSLINLEIH